jgi:hypothetical protein
MHAATRERGGGGGARIRGKKRKDNRANPHTHSAMACVVRFVE